MHILDKVAPVKEVRLKQRTEPWFDMEILNLIQERDKLLYQFKKTNDAVLYSEYKKLRNKTQNEINKAKSAFYAAKVEENKNQPKKLWATLKTLGTSTKNSTNSSNIGLKIGEDICFEKPLVAEKFNSFFTNIATTLVSKLPQSTGKYNQSFIQDYYKSNGVQSDHFVLSPVGEDDVLKLLLALKSSKATGLDSLPSRFIRDGANIICAPVTHIINLSIYHGSIPSDLKSARVVPLYKKNSKTDLGNYRPVSILSILSKVLERVVYNQLENYLHCNSLMYNLQSGFRPAYSTDTCLIHMQDHIREEYDKGNYTGMVLLDLQKAFDTVDHVILLDKLGAMGLNKMAINWFRAYLTCRTQVTDVGGVFSSPGDITCGVPQGSILGPLLFLVYVNDMPAAVKCKLLLYADDSALLVSGRDIGVIEETLSSELYSVSEWLVDNKLSLHLGKTESILFGTKRKLKKQASLNVKCNGVSIQSSSTVKYLGIEMDQSLSGEVIAEKVIKKVNSRLKFLHRKAKYLNSYCRKLLVSSLLQCHIDYACCTWYSGLTRKLQNRLQVCQNKMIRYVLGCQARVHIGAKEFDMVNWVPIRHRVEQLKLNHVFKIVHGISPPYLKVGFKLISDVHSHNIRGSVKALFKPRVGSHCQKSFRYTAILAWNSLPEIIRQQETLGIFKYRVKRFMCQQVRLQEEQEYVYYS